MMAFSIVVLSSSSQGMGFLYFPLGQSRLNVLKYAIMLLKTKQKNLLKHLSSVCSRHHPQQLCKARTTSAAQIGKVKSRESERLGSDHTVRICSWPVFFDHCDSPSERSFDSTCMLFWVASLVMLFIFRKKMTVCLFSSSLNHLVLKVNAQISSVQLAHWWTNNGFSNPLLNIYVMN